MMCVFFFMFFLFFYSWKPSQGWEVWWMEWMSRAWRRGQREMWPVLLPLVLRYWSSFLLCSFTFLFWNRILMLEYKSIILCDMSKWKRDKNGEWRTNKTKYVKKIDFFAAFPVWFYVALVVREPPSYQQNVTGWYLICIIAMCKWL